LTLLAVVTDGLYAYALCRADRPDWNPAEWMVYTSEGPESTHVYPNFEEAAETLQFSRLDPDLEEVAAAFNELAKHRARDETQHGSHRYKWGNLAARHRWNLAQVRVNAAIGRRDLINPDRRQQVLDARLPNSTSSTGRSGSADLSSRRTETSVEYAAAPNCVKCSEHACLSPMRRGYDCP
jgi:hypothetical protein